MNKRISHNILLIILALVATESAYTQTSDYEIVWFDEFESDEGIDMTKWHFQTELPNGDSWYNGEIQHYTDRLSNAYVSNGTLKIVAIKENYTDQGVTKEYTSARLNSKFSFTYGKVEVRATLPTQLGTWPAIWMLGKNIIEQGAYWSSTHGEVYWPECGEMDIMEHWGNNPNYVQSATHTPSSFGATENLGGQMLNNVANEFHVYELEWTPEELIFSVDGNEHFTYQPDVQNASTWPFHGDQYLLMNIAILPEIESNFNQDQMEIDYVRIYQQVTSTGFNNRHDEMRISFSNPVDNECIFMVPADLIGAEVTVYSLSGKEVEIFYLNEQKTLQDFSGYQKGIYTIKIEKGTEIFTTKLLKI